MQFATRRGIIVDSDNNFDGLALSDVLYVLSREYRFAGNSPYSVLHHSVAMGMVARAVGEAPTVVSGCVTHDFQEAFVRDVPTQVKRRLTGYEELERELYDKLMLCFDTHNLYDLDASDQRKIWKWDKLACAVELASFTTLDRTTDFSEDHIALFSDILVSTRHLTYDSLCTRLKSMLWLYS